MIQAMASPDGSLYPIHDDVMTFVIGSYRQKMKIDERIKMVLIVVVPARPMKADSSMLHGIRQIHTSLRSLARHLPAWYIGHVFMIRPMIKH